MEINKEEKIELLDNWKATLLNDIDVYQQEVQLVLDKKDRAQKVFNNKLKKLSKELSRAQGRVDKTKIQLDKVEQEIQNIKN